MHFQDQKIDPQMNADNADKKTKLLSSQSSLTDCESVMCK